MSAAWLVNIGGGRMGDFFGMELRGKKRFSVNETSRRVGGRGISSLFRSFTRFTVPGLRRGGKGHPSFFGIR